MPIQEKSSLSGNETALGLTRRDHGAIAAAVAPLMLLFFNIGAPRPAFGQCKDKSPERAMSYVPQQANLALDDDGLAPLPTFVTVHADAGRDLGATPRLQALLAAIRPEPDRPAPALMREPIVGIASTYNPCCPGTPADEAETASGETYDAEGWTAAIQIGLRHRFGGVRFGASYRPAYALVEGAGKRLIVKVNDVGPLKPGRVIDLNERAMRYFDPTQTLGLLTNVRITPLDGRHWRAGPVEDAPTAAAIRHEQQAPRQQVVATLN